jgi:hypothetical protein
MGLVRSTNFMRLSLKKAAHATMGGAAYRKTGSERALCARCGIPRTSTVRPGLAWNVRRIGHRMIGICDLSVFPGPEGRSPNVLATPSPSLRGSEVGAESANYILQHPGFPLIWTVLSSTRTSALLIGWCSIGAVPAPGVTAGSSFQVVSCRKYEVGTVVVVILPWLEFCGRRSEGRFG